MLENWDVFTRGILLGVMVAAPVGPVGLLCIRRTIQKGLFIGFATGFGAAFADAFFSAVAALGVSTITDVLGKYNNEIHLVGGLILLFIAWHAWHDKPRQADPDEVEQKYLTRRHIKLRGAFKSMATSFLITLTNPATLFGVMAVVAAFGGLKSGMEAGTIITGIFLGSSLWWGLLSGGVSLVRGHFTESRVMTLNRITALALVGIAIWAFVSGLVTLAGLEMALV